MKVGYAVLYEDGELVISKNHTILPKPIFKDYVDCSAQLKLAGSI